MSLDYTDQNALEDAYMQGKSEGFLEGLQEAARVLAGAKQFEEALKVVQGAIEEEEKGGK